MKKKLWDSILISVLVTLVTAGIAMLFVDTQSDWYLALEKPAFQPPPIVFGIAWSIIYILFAVSLTFAQLKEVPTKTYVFYGMQAALNILWCLFFFTWHMLYAALFVIIAYLVVTYLTVRKVYDYSKVGALVLIPQIVWLGLAMAINYTIIILN